MGQFDSTQNATSIPYEIHVEQSIIDALQKLTTPTTESPAAGEAQEAAEVWRTNSLDRHSVLTIQ